MQALTQARWLLIAAALLCAALALLPLIFPQAAVATGSGGLVHGFFVMFPAMAIALLTQNAALIGFARQPRA